MYKQLLHAHTTHIQVVWYESTTATTTTTKKNNKLLSWWMQNTNLYTSVYLSVSDTEMQGKRQATPMRIYCENNKKPPKT